MILWLKVSLVGSTGGGGGDDDGGDDVGGGDDGGGDDGTGSSTVNITLSVGDASPSAVTVTSNAWGWDGRVIVQPQIMEMALGQLLWTLLRQRQSMSGS